MSDGLHVGEGVHAAGEEAALTFAEVSSLPFVTKNSLDRWLLARL